MSQRSVHNKRYQKDAKVGSTRKSAGRMRPKKSDSAAPTKKKKSAFKRAAEQSRKSRPVLPRMPETAEVKRFNRLYWVSMTVALLAALAFLVPGVQDNNTLVTIVWSVWGAGIATGLYIQLFVLRRLRNQAIDAMKSEKMKSDKKK